MICFRNIRDDYKRTDSNPVSFRIDDHLWSSKEVFHDEIIHFSSSSNNSTIFVLKIPFPAITICPEQDLNLSRFYEIERILKNKEMWVKQICQIWEEKI